MSKKYVNIAAAWLKNGKNGQYISAVAGNKNSKAKLFVELEDGTVKEVTTFAGFFEQEKKNENAPDLRFTFSYED